FPPNLPAGAAGKFGQPLRLELRFEGGMAGEQKRAGTVQSFRPAKYAARGHAGTSEGCTVKQRRPLEPCDEVDESEAVHRGSLVRPLGQGGAERLIDGAAIVLRLQGREVDADRPTEIEPADRVCQGGHRSQRERARIERAVHVDQQHRGRWAELQSATGKGDFTGERFGKKIEPVTCRESAYDA